ncbi:hypothetical protein D3C72_487200 [compost metagenome]
MYLAGELMKKNPELALMWCLIADALRNEEAITKIEAIMPLLDDDSVLAAKIRAEGWIKMNFPYRFEEMSVRRISFR